MIITERNVQLSFNDFEEFQGDLNRRNWHKKIENLEEGSIDVALVKEFYANVYDLEDKSPKQVKVRGQWIPFDSVALNSFLETPVVIEEGESLPAYAKFVLLRPNQQELAAYLCIPGKGFELNLDGLPLKILRKNLTTLAQTWSVFSFSNLAPTSHTSSQITLMAQHDSWRLGFPALITALCKARGVHSDSLTHERLSPAINLAYIKKKCWNLDDLSVTFRGSHKAKGKRSEVM